LDAQQQVWEEEQQQRLQQQQARNAQGASGPVASLRR
jgi:hypothetical protein